MLDFTAARSLAERDRASAADFQSRERAKVLATAISRSASLRLAQDFSPALQGLSGIGMLIETKVRPRDEGSSFEPSSGSKATGRRRNGELRNPAMPCVW